MNIFLNVIQLRCTKSFRNTFTPLKTAMQAVHLCWKGLLLRDNRPRYNGQQLVFELFRSRQSPCYPWFRLWPRQTVCHFPRWQIVSMLSHLLKPSLLRNYQKWVKFCCFFFSSICTPGQVRLFYICCKHIQRQLWQTVSQHSVYSTDVCHSSHPNQYWQ